jgi:alkylhydroperoxidase family enzyme
MNSKDFERKGVSEEEIRALQEKRPLDQVESFADRERAALAYVQCMCQTPLAFTAEVMDRLTRSFTPRAVVIIASTCAQVNFWARLIQALGVPPAGFSAECSVLNLNAFKTLR